MSWRPGDPAPKRPQGSEFDSQAEYSKALGRYADRLEEMLVWLARDYGGFAQKVRAAMERRSK